MSTVQSEAARRRWSRATAEERRESTRAAVEASHRRRDVANALLAAAESAGLRVDLAEPEPAEGAPS